MPHEIIPQQLAIRSMRSSGYRDTAHAIAELIDNSIQAGEGVNQRTEVEVLCVDRYRTINTRKRRQLDEIAVYDNACGMDPKTLRDALQFGNGTRLTRANQKGIGKFGMGLPNASISQCSKLEVWSWRDGACFHTYLDVEQIEKGGAQGSSGTGAKHDPGALAGDPSRSHRRARNAGGLESTRSRDLEGQQGPARKF